MGYLKKNVKNQNPKDYDELKKVCIEEWNKIDPRNYFKNYLRRVNMVLTLKGDRIQDPHIKQIRKEERKEERKKERKIEENEEDEEEEKEEKEEKNETVIGNRKIKRVFNEVFLNNLKNKEIRSLKKKKKEISNSYNQRIKENKTKTIKTKKNMADDIKEDLNDMTFFDRNMLGFNKNYDLKLFNQKIKKLEGYSLDEYLKYCLKKEEKKQEEE